MLTSIGLPSFPPSLSTNGRRVSYLGASSSLRVRDTQLGVDIYSNTTPATSAILSPDGARILYVSGGAVKVDDVMNGTNLLSFPSTTTLQSSAQWSGDSRFVAFVGTTNTATGPIQAVFLYDTLDDSINLVGINYAHTGPANGPSDMPAVGGDGRFVMYRSFATDLVAGDLNPVPKIFAYDRLTGLNTILSPAQTDASAFPWISRPVVSVGGQQVAFQSIGSSLVPGDLNRVSDAFAVGLDSDGDGIPDWWELQYFGHATGEASDFSRAQDDADGDGVSNLQEYLNGTDPRNTTVGFSVQILPATSQNNAAVLTWPTATVVTYTVQYKNDLNDLQWQNLPGNVSIIGNRAYFDVPLDQAAQFYRIVGSN